MSNPKRVLGRGLADLLPAGGDATDSTAALGPGQEVPIASLHPNPRQPRTRFNEAALEELTESIRHNGILQPLLVRPRPTGGYEIVAGERRYRAALRAGLRQVPVVVRKLSDEETLALALIENLIREDITPLEAARAFQRLMEDFGWTQEEMGKRVGKSRSAVANSLRLLKLPEVIQSSLEKGELTEGHARTLLGDERNAQEASFKARQMRVFQQIKEQGLSVREVERLMKEEKLASSNSSSPDHRRFSSVGESPRESPVFAEMASITVSSGEFPKPDSFPSIESTAPRREPPHVVQANLRFVEDKLRSLLGTRVKVTGTEEQGKVEIEYFSADTLHELLARLEPRPEPAPNLQPRIVENENTASPFKPSSPSEPRKSPMGIKGLLTGRDGGKLPLDNNLPD